MPYLRDNHFGKEQFTKHHFIFKQQAVYPIIAAVGIAVSIAVASCVKNLTGNSNVSLAHSHLGAWNSRSLNEMDVADTFHARPAPEPVLAPADN